MKYLLEGKVMEELERAACRLESMGSILEHLCEPDRPQPDIASLGDLGNVISRGAMELLDLLSEKERCTGQLAYDVLAESLAETVPHVEEEVELAQVWFVPEIPKD